MPSVCLTFVLIFDRQGRESGHADGSVKAQSAEMILQRLGRQRASQTQLSVCCVRFREMFLGRPPGPASVVPLLYPASDPGRDDISPSRIQTSQRYFHDHVPRRFHLCHLGRVYTG
jgi:hypothetical protein